MSVVSAGCSKEDTFIQTKMQSSLSIVLLLSAVTAVLCFRNPPGGGPLRPNIPTTPPFYPRNHGLPPIYRNFRHARSINGEVAPFEGQEMEHPVAENFRFQRSAEEYFKEEPMFTGEQHEMTRQKRSPGYRIIHPTYRPGPKGPPKIYRV